MIDYAPRTLLPDSETGRQSQTTKPGGKIKCMK